MLSGLFSECFIINYILLIDMNYYKMVITAIALKRAILEDATGW